MHDNFEYLTALSTIFGAWREFKKGKENKLDVQQFSFALEDNLFDLHRNLQEGRYRHAGYLQFYVRDPKLRSIHKAAVADRVIHHAVTQVLERLFDHTFIADSYANRTGKGLHRAVRRLRRMGWRLGRNRTRTVWFLKCDVRKFFDSANHATLLSLLCRRVRDERFFQLLKDIITSFQTRPGCGIPLGNLTSQIFSNIYLDPFDQFVKRTLRVKNYVRYADDFIIASCDRSYLEDLIPILRGFLQEKLQLELHPDKIFLKKWHQGIDFLGYVLFPRHAVLRTKTKRRLLRKLRQRVTEFEAGKISQEALLATANSYQGLLKHCRGVGIDRMIREIVPVPLLERKR